VLLRKNLGCVGILGELIVPGNSNGAGKSAAVAALWRKKPVEVKKEKRKEKKNKKEGKGLVDLAGDD
ncbi:hypothetical protein HAX54_003933, partial [Datura stramonium]|nr:hypothetical protein [Datura stramonium]